MEGEGEILTAGDQGAREMGETHPITYPEPGIVADTIEQLKVLGVKVSTLKKAFSEYRRKHEEGGQDLEGPYGRLKDRMDKGWATWSSTRLGLDMTLARMSLTALKEIGRPVDELKERIEGIDANDTKKAAEGMEAASLLRIDMASALEGHTDRVLPEAWMALDRAMDSFEEVAKVPEKADKVKRLFKKVLQAVSKQDINNTLVYSKTLYTEVQKLLSDEIAKDRFKAIKDEITGLMDQMEEYRKFGLETEVLRSELSIIDKSLGTGKVLEAQGHMNRIAKNLSRTENELHRRKGMVNLIEAMELVEEYGPLLDLSEERSHLLKLVEDKGKMSPKKFMDETSAVLERIKDTLFSNFQGQVKERLETLERSMVGIGFISEERRFQLMDLKRSIDDSLKDRNISEAMEYISLAESTFGQSDGEIRLLEIKSNYSRFLKEYEMLLEEDMEIAEVKEQLEELERMFLSDDVGMEDLSTRVYQAGVLVQDRIVDLRKKAFGKERDRLLGMMDSISLSGGARSKLEGRLDELGSLIGSVEESVFEKDLSMFRTELESEISSFVKDNYPSWSQRVSGQMDSLASSNVDLSSLRPRIEEANGLFSAGDLLEAGEVMRELEQEVVKLEDDIELKMAEELINSAEFMFEEAVRAGANVKDKKGSLNRAKELMASGDLEGAMELAREVEGSVKGSWMEMKKGRLESEMKGLKTYMEDSTNLGLDLSDATSMLHEAEFMFNEQRLDQVSDLVSRAREDLEGKRNAFFSDSAMNTINKLKDEIGTLGQMGVDNLEAETMLIEAERLFMNEDYEKAYSLTLNIREQLNESRDSYLNELVPRELSDIRSRMGRLESLGLDTSSIRQLLNNAEEAQSSGTLLEGIDSLKKAREVSDELFRSHITLAIPDTIVDVKKQIDIAMDEGMDLSDVKELLANAEELFRTEQYDMAMEVVERAQDTFKSVKKEFFKGKYLKNMELVENIVDKAEGLDMEMDLSRANINMAKDAFERGDFESSHTLMEKVMKFLERSMDERSVSKQRETVQTYYDEVRTLLMVAEGENIDVSDEQGLFRIVGELMTKGDFEQAEHVLEGIKLGVNDKRLSMKRRVIERSIQTTDILLQNMNGMGIDTSAEQALIEQLKEALRRNDLDLCDEINLKLINTLQRNEGPYTVQKVQRELSELRASIVEANSLGLDTKVPQQYLTDAIELFENNDLEGSERLIGEGKVSLAALLEERKIGEFEMALSDLRTLMDQAVSISIPVDDEEALISSARVGLEGGDIETAMSLLETATIGVDAKLSSNYQTTSEGYIPQISAYLKELMGLGLDMSDLTAIYNDGLSDHGSGDYRKAVNKFASILELGQEMRNQKELSILRRTLTKQEQRYADLKGIGMKPSKKLDEAFESAKAVVMRESVDLSKVEDIIKRLDLYLNKKAIPYIKDLSKKHITEARLAIKESSPSGEDPNIVTKLKEAAKSFNAGDFETADRIALSLREEVEKVRLEETEQVLKSEIDSVKRVLLRLKTLGSNVSNAEKLVARSEAALGSGRYDNAENLIEAVKEAVSEVVTRNQRETALETIEFVEALVKYLSENFSGVSSQIGPANELVKMARNSFKERSFKDARQKAEEAKVLIERSELQNIDQFLYVFRNMQAEEISKAVRTRIDELANRGSEVTKVNMLFDKAQEHFSKEDYEKGRQMITFARVMMSEMDQQSLRDSAVDELNSSHLEILAMKKDGMDVTGPYKLYNNAKDAFTSGEYKKAILLAKKACLRPKK